MKAEYFPATKDMGTSIILVAESLEEQRALTVLRDIGLDPGKGIVLRVAGAEWVDKVIPRLPPHPVTRLRLAAEHRSGQPYDPKKTPPADPNKIVHEPKEGVRTAIAPDGTKIVEIR